MLIADILHSCANGRVAQAAVASIGGTFADAFRDAARERDMGTGALAVLLVRRFAGEATERDWQLVTSAIGAADIPVLCGLRVILERMLEKSATMDVAATSGGTTRGARLSAAASRDAVDCGAAL